MPSILGAIAVYVFASRGTKWVIPAAAFWVLIFVASGYFGYHYWVDGIAAAAIAALCYSGAAIFFRVPAPAPSESTLLPA